MFELQACKSVLLLFLIITIAQCRQNSRKKKPNIIFIMADDLGWNDVGFHNSKVKTPNIDWLARRGIELTDYHAQPMCTPSRAALMTGKYPSNNGLHHNLIGIPAKNCLPLEHKILPEYLKDLGYATKYVGKWHLGDCHKGCLPTNRGFDEFRGITPGQSGYFNWVENDIMVRYVNDTPSAENIGTHMTIQDKKDVREIIRTRRESESPLFMMISPTAPHSPLEVTPKMFKVHDFLSKDDPTSESRRKYLGLVSALDDVVGETIKALKDADLFDNSVIIFTSDNGGANIGPPLPGFESFGNNYPLRNGKGSYFEGGTKVPTVYLDNRLPKKTRRTQRDFLMHITDWLPTFIELAGGKPVRRNIDGISQRINLNKKYRGSQRYRRRKEFLIMIRNFTNSFSPSLCADGDTGYRLEDWKLIYSRVESLASPFLPSEWVKPAESPELPDITGDSCIRTDEDGNKLIRCLFNLKDDPSEQINLFDTRPDMVSQLLTKINKFRAKRVQNTYSGSLEANNLTTRSLGDLRVPIQGYCKPKVDFPLKPHDPSCDDIDSELFQI